MQLFLREKQVFQILNNIQPHYVANQCDKGSSSSLVIDRERDSERETDRHRRRFIAKEKLALLKIPRPTN